jgi:hypothetical protein
LADWRVTVGDDYAQWETPVAEIPFEIELSEAWGGQHRYIRTGYTQIYVTLGLDVDDTPEVGREILQAVADVLMDRSTYKQWKAEIDEDCYDFKFQVKTGTVEAWVNRVVEALSASSVQDLLQRVSGNLSTSTSDQVAPEEFR